MANTLNTRIAMRYDTFENWKKNDPELLQGEVAVVVVPVNSNSVDVNGNAVIDEPAILIKVGQEVNGVKKKFSELGYVSAIAADVYDWAKEEWLSLETIKGIDGIEDYLRQTAVQDSNTTYKIEHVMDDKQKETDVIKLFKHDLDDDKDWSEVCSIDLSKAKSIAEMQGRITGLETAFDQYMTDHDGVHTQLGLQIGGVVDKVDVLIGGDVDSEGKVKSVRDVAIEVLTDNIVGSHDAYDTLTEMSAWLKAHPQEAGQMNEWVTELQTSVYGVNGENAGSNNGGLKKAVSDLQTLTGGVTAGKTIMEDVAGKIADALNDYTTNVLNGVSTIAGEAAELAGENAGAITLINDGLYGSGGSLDDPKDESIVKRLKDAEGSVTDIKTALYGTGTDAESANGSSIGRRIKDLESDYDKIQDIARAEYNAKYLTQDVSDPGDYLVLNCGTAAASFA